MTAASRIGIVCPLYFEAACFTTRQPIARQPVALNERTSLIISGMGADNARRAAQRLIGENIGCLVSFGTAGALAPGLQPGDVIRPGEVVRGGESYAPDAPLPATLRRRLSRENIAIHDGRLLSADKVCSGTDAKRQLLGETGAIAVDMETAGILEVAARRGLPALVLRVIADPAELALPGVILERIDEVGEIGVLSLCAGLMRSPGQIPAALRLAGCARRARKTLRLIARELLR